MTREEWALHKAYDQVEELLDFLNNNEIEMGLNDDDLASIVEVLALLGEAISRKL